MIILTTSVIKDFEPIRISSIVEYAGTKYCLAIVSDDLELPQTDEELEDSGLNFWWEVEGMTLLDISDFRRSYKFEGGTIEAIDWFLGITKPKNIAPIIATYCSTREIDPFILWESQIKGKRKKKTSSN